MVGGDERGVCKQARAGPELEKFGGGTSEERNTGRSFTSSCQRANAAAADAVFGDRVCSSSEAWECDSCGNPSARYAEKLLINVRTFTLADKHPGYVPPPPTY